MHPFRLLKRIVIICFAAWLGYVVYMRQHMVSTIAGNISDPGTTSSHESSGGIGKVGGIGGVGSGGAKPWRPDIPHHAR